MTREEIEELIQQTKAEFLNEKVVKESDLETAQKQSYAKGWNACNDRWIQTLNEYLSKLQKEPCEIHLTCTDEEIAKSFIEDVEAVKDQLPEDYLKPCPFCGSEALTRSVDGGCLPSFMSLEKQDEILSKTPYVTSCSLECDECGVIVQGYAATDDMDNNDIFDKAVEDCYQKWNRRISDERNTY